MLLGIVVLWTVVFATIMRKRTERTQRITFIILGAICSLFMSLRWIWGTGYYVIPLELCNIGAYMILFAAIFKKRPLLVFAIYLNIIGAIVGLAVWPTTFMYPNNLVSMEFLDYYFVHAQLIVVPVAFVACGWYRPRIKDALLASVLLVITASAVFGLVSWLNHIALFPGASANHMSVIHDHGYPFLDILFEWWPVPLVYMLPVVPVAFIALVILTLPFVPRGEYRTQFKELLYGAKTLGFK